MAEPAKPSAGPVRANPLYDDPVLFDMYMKALDIVLAEQEVRSAFDEFDLSAATLRMTMVRGAGRVLGAASGEFAAYEEAMAHQFDDAGADQRRTPGGVHWEFDGILRYSWIGAAVAGALLMAGAVASMTAWPWAAQPLFSAGGSILVVAAVSWVSLRVLGTDFGIRLLEGDIPGASLSLVSARDRLMAAVSEAELLAQVRTFINTARQGRFGHAYSVAGSPGLNEVYDSVYSVPTEIAAELDGLLGRLGGASIGVAGPRGSGKSTLIRGYCDEAGSAVGDYEEFGWTSLLDPDLPERARGDLRCVVAAPVDYVARDFVLHMFAAFCRAVVGRYSKKAGEFPGAILIVFWLRRIGRLAGSLLERAVFYGGTAAALLYWEHAIALRISVPARWVRYAAIALICAGILSFLWSSAIKIRRWVRQLRGGDDEALAATARRHLARIRYLQTYTSGWSGALSLPGGARGEHSRGISRAQQPLSYPEIVDEFRNFARDVAAGVHRKGDRVFIGVDELDKIGSAEQAERFLGEIKGIFGIPHLYFMVSVSDDALTAFERRGLPLRDAFDSSFDEIIYVGPLSYAESRRLLYRRVIGLTEPYVALCHCLAGGLARDLIRAARRVVRTAATLTATGSSSAAANTAEEHIIDASTAYLLLRGKPANQPPAFAVISAAVVHDELRRKLRAVSHVLGNATPGDATELQSILYDITGHLALGEAAINIVDLVAKPGPDEPPRVVKLRLDFAAYAYYCATLQEVFTDNLDSEHMVKATSATAGPGSFDALAAARYAFTLDTQLAWRSITQFRKAWSLETREPVTRHQPGAD